MPCWPSSSWRRPPQRAPVRWYITSAFTTFFVCLLLLFDQPRQAVQKIDERVGETIVGVALAYLFGWAVPELVARTRPPADATPGSPSASA